MAEKGKPSTSRDEVPEDFGSAEAAAEFWDTHDQTDYEDITEPVQFDIDTRTQEYLIALDPEVTRGLEAQAERRHVSPETLANRWLQERLDKVRK